jgi:hypothetical protein
MTIKNFASEFVVYLFNFLKYLSIFKKYIELKYKYKTIFRKSGFLFELRKQIIKH